MRRRIERGFSMGLWAEIRKLAEIRQPEPRKPDFGHPEEQLSGLHKDLNGAIVEQGRNHPAWKHTLAKAAGAPSEFGEFGVWVAASRSHGRRPRWQAEGVENLADHDGIFDGCQNSHPVQTPRGKSKRPGRRVVAASQMQGAMC